MSLKAIEMQIALPRTHDAGRIQEQLEQRNLVAQHNAALEVHKEDEKKRSTVLKQEQKDITHFHEEGSQGEHQQSDRKNKKKNTPENNSKHPYKGSSIDFSG